MANDWLGPDSSKWIGVALDPVMREPRKAVMSRERSTFDTLAGPNPSSIILFGAGSLGRSTLCGLRKVGIEPHGFADNRSELWGKDVDGVPVFSPAEATERFRSRAAFVVTVYNGRVVREQLYTLGCAFVVPPAPLFWKFAEAFIPTQGIDLPHRMQEQVDAILSGYAVLADDHSRRTFCEQIRWRFLLDDHCLSCPSSPKLMYFPPDLVKPIEDEAFVDCGAYDGDSIRSFLAFRHEKFRRIFALEPDAANRKALSSFLAQLPERLASRITVLPFAAADCAKTISLSAAGTASATILSGAGAQQVECRPLDQLLYGEVPTYIKMDIEAAEPDAIRGAQKLIATHVPVVAACVYHRYEHLWQIPSQLKQLSERYAVYLRRYAEESWEMVCYAVPQSRIPA